MRVDETSEQSAQRHADLKLLALLPYRIRTRLIRAGACLLWAGARHEKGYGLVWFEGKKRRVTHVIFKLIRGRWPRSDRELLHFCDTPPCCAPWHLREGTTRQNARDRQAKGRTRGCVKSVERAVVSGRFPEPRTSLNRCWRGGPEALAGSSCR